MFQTNIRGPLVLMIVRMSLCGADVFSFALLLSLLAPNCP